LSARLTTAAAARGLRLIRSASSSSSSGRTLVSLTLLWYSHTFRSSVH
jgi:hypothetical protein